MTLNAGRGIDTVSTSDGGNRYRVGQSVTVTASEARGYNWDKWTATGVDGSTNKSYTFTMPTNAVTLIANTTPRDDTPYTVKHWKQNIEASELGITEVGEAYYTEVEEDRVTTLVGTTDSEGTGDVNQYTGFTSPPKSTVTITGDGEAVLNYYYTRNKYQLTLNAERGVAAALTSGSYPYEKPITINAMMYVGYVWDKWTGSGLRNPDGTEKVEIDDIKYEFNMPANDVEYTTNTIPNPDTKYTIKHWKQKLGGNEEDWEGGYMKPPEVVVLTGETDSRVNPPTKDYPGFKAPDAKGISVPITGEGTLIVDYFYTRKKYDVKLNKGKGIENIRVTGNVSGEGQDQYLYEETVTIEAEKAPGYTWSGWTGEEEDENPTHQFTIGLKNVEYTANATPNEDTPYIVQHWRQKVDGDASIHDEANYELVEPDDTEHLTGTTDTQTDTRPREYIGFKIPEIKNENIEGNGTTIVRYYYERKTDVPYVVKHWQQTVEAAIRENSNNAEEKEETPFEEIELIDLAEIDITETKEGEENTETEEISEDGNYKLIETRDGTGMTGAEISPDTQEYIGFKTPEKQTTTIEGDGSTVINYYYDRKTDIPYIIQHWKENLPTETNETGENSNPDDVGAISNRPPFEEPPETNDIEDTNPASVGAPFEGIPVRDDTTVPNEKNKNYTLTDTDNLNGITGRTITPETKEYPGFTAPDPEQVEIKADGSLIVNYYYTRNTNTPYKVYHWTQNLGGNKDILTDKNYTIRETEELGGITEATITPKVKQYEGFISPQIKQLTIAPDGSSELNYYYTRRTDLTALIKHIDKNTEKTIFKRTLKNQIFESQVNLTEEIMDIEDYNYDSTEPEVLKIGTGENTATIYYVKKEGKIIIHHYIYDEKTNTYSTVKLVEDNEIIGKIGDDYKTEASSEIPENYIVVDNTPENYIGRIEGQTKEINYYYKLKTPKVESGVGSEIIEGGEKTEDGKWKITAGEEIKYRIRYNTQIEEYKGKIKIEVKAILPQGTKIDQEKCDFSEGTYEEESNTIIWTKEIAEINTFQNGTYADGINKEITIVYAEDYIVDELAPKVIGKTLLYYPDDYIIGGGGEGETPPPPFVDDETDGTGKIIIHHYIYNAEENKYTEKRIAPDEEIIEKIGNKYSTRPSIEIPINYTCINEEPEGYAGTITRKTQEISYYYKLKTPETTGSTDSEIITGIGKDEDGNYIITAGQEVKYKIKYETKIKDYKGKALIEVKAELPEGTEIEQENCDFVGGTYDEESNTITWTKEITEIDTFTNGIYTDKIEKEITIVYANDYVLEDANLRITGKTKLYYPEDDPDKGGQVITGGGKIITHHYIYNEKTNEETDIKIAPDEETIKEIGSKYTTKPSEKIPANYECINKQPENYKGTTKEGTTEISYYYKIKEPTIDTSAGAEIIEGIEQTEDGKWQITAGQPVKYKIKYKTEIEDYIGRAKVEIKAKLPEGTEIEQESCDFAEGTYDEETNTITWTKEIENIDTYAHTNNTKQNNEPGETTEPINDEQNENPETTPSTNDTTIPEENETYVDGTYILEIIKEITIVYANDYILEDATPKVTGKTTLYYPEGHPGGKDEILGQEETDGKGKIIIHHYIYDEKTNTYTKQKLVADEQQKGEIGAEYQTTPSNKIPANYECVDEQPEGYTGRYTIETIKINYYYKLKTPGVDSEIETDIISGGSRDENGNWIIKAGEEIKYKINYKTKIKDYKGKATIEIIATLPEGTTGIDQRKSKLEGGTYNKETNTITWTKEIDEIDTFANGEYAETIEKQITIVYDKDYVLEDIELKVTGKTKLYYPDDYPIKGGENDTFTEDETIVGGKIIVHHYIYDAEANKNTTIKIVADEKVKGKLGEQYTTKPSSKIPANYECINTEPEGYTGTITKEEKEVSYHYKLKTPKVESEVDSNVISGGTQDEDGNWIIKAGEEIKYQVNYKTKITDYIGKALIEITAELPEGTGIDEAKCNLSGGTYDKATNTIKWTKEITGIDTFANGEYVETIEKQITIVYDNDYVLQDISLNVKGKTILYYPEGHPGGTGNKPLVEDQIDEKGKIIIHHYIYEENEENKYTTKKLVADEEIADKIGTKYQTKPSNKISASYECINEQPEGHEGEIGKGKKEISYYYKLKPSTVESSTNSSIISGTEKDENGNWIIKKGQPVKYKIEYETKIKDYKGKALIEITAKLPEGTGIEEAKCDIAGGTYDEETNTITWTKEVENIDTFAHIGETTSNNNPDNTTDVGAISNRPQYINGIYVFEFEKEITIYYDNDYVLENANLDVKGKTTLYYPDDYPEKGGQINKNTGGKITIHHYIYKEEENKYTETKVAPDQEIAKEIGQKYETRPSSKVPSNYECINEQPEGYEGTTTKEPIEITYYYKLIETKVEGSGDSNITSGGTQDEEGNWIIKKGEEIKYKVKYEAKIKDYIGKAIIEIKAELPKGTEIDETKCDLSGGTYDKATNTITWTKEVENIDTFANGEYVETIEKDITIVYAQDYILKDANLKITGNITTYYPDEYPDKGGQETGNTSIIIHHYIYDADDNKYTNQKLVEDEKQEGKIGQKYETKPSTKIPANYQVIDEKPEGYAGEMTKEIKEISYYYKLTKPKTEGSGSSNITSGGTQDENGNWVIKAGEEIKYEIEYEAKIDDYIGKATIEIKAELPEGTKIDPSKSDLNGGTYDEATNTITWVKEIDNINTYENGPYTEKITQNIKIVYAEDYVLKDANLKITGNIITYYPEGYPDKGGQTIPNENGGNKPGENPEEKQGKIIIKYVEEKTNQEIEIEGQTYGYEINGKIGERYEAKEKEIPYHILLRKAENAKGEIKEEIQIVTYYYRKAEYNIGIEKTIDTINLNGKNIMINNKETAKLELKKEDIKKTELIVKYNIKVINKGELGGTSKILEIIPEGYEIAYLPEEWKVNRNGTLEAKVDLEAGQSKTLSIALRWENKENNLGAKTNEARIEESKNLANFEETNKEDNISKATIVLSIKTGEVVSIIIIMMILTSLGICSYITITTIRKKDPDIKDIKFLK